MFLHRNTPHPCLWILAHEVFVSLWAKRGVVQSPCLVSPRPKVLNDRHFIWIYFLFPPKIRRLPSGAADFSWSARPLGSRLRRLLEDTAIKENKEPLFFDWMVVSQNNGPPGKVLSYLTISIFIDFDCICYWFLCMDQQQASRDKIASLSLHRTYTASSWPAQSLSIESSLTTALLFSPRRGRLPIKVSPIFG